MINGGNIALQTTTSGNLGLNQMVSAGAVTLKSAGTISQTGGTITAATLTGSSSGTASFVQPGNNVTSLDAFSTGNGDFALTDGQALNLTGALNAGTGRVTLQVGGALQQTGAIVAQNLVARTQLDQGADITLTNPGNAVQGNVTLSALNTAGTAPAAGAISF